MHHRKLRRKETFNNIFMVIAVGFLSWLSACTVNKTSLSEIDHLQDQFIIGWQTAWDPAGQIAQTLIHTDIPEKNGVKLNFKAFLFGTEMNEAALSKQLNCLNTGS